MKKYKLTEEEQEILDYFEQDDVIRKPISSEVEKEINIAKICLLIAFLVPLHDLNTIKRVTAQEGMPYQTLIASVLHKYASGYLKLDKFS